MTAPSIRNQRLLWMHLNVRKDPYGNLIREWATERNITMTEMMERVVTTYAAMLNHKVIGE